MVQQAEAETDQVVKVGLKLFQELGDRTKKMETEISLYRETVLKLATREGVEVPDFMKDESGGLGDDQAAQLREWLGQLLGPSATGEERTKTKTTVTRATSRKRGGPVGRGTSRKRGGKDDDDDEAMGH